MLIEDKTQERDILGTKTISGVYAVTIADINFILKADTSGGAVTVNMFQISTMKTNSGRIIVEDESGNAGTNNITINAFAGDTINGAASMVLNQNNASTVIEVVDDVKWNATIADLSDLVGVLPIASGGTGQITAQLAINALATVGAAGTYLRSDGVDDLMSAIQVADVPTLNQNTTGTASNVTGVVAIANGGTGQVTQTAAFNALDPLTTKGDIITHDGTNSVRQAVGANGTIIVADSTQANGLKRADVAASGITTRVAVVTGINAKVVASTSLYTVPAATQFITDFVVTYVTTVTGSGNGPRYSLGTNAATYNNILGTTFTVGMDTIVFNNRANVVGTAHIGAAAEVVTYNIVLASTATTMTVSVELRGHFI